MAKAKSKAKAKTKSKIGRPVTVGGTALVNARVSAALSAEVDRWAASHGTPRSDAIRQLLEAGLKAKG